ncbi:MAG: hypothetical protein ACRDHN_19580 [Thermomicrobiales bacterium]
MGELYEAIPISAGVRLGLIFARYRPSTQALKWGITGVVAILVGLTASILSGEIHDSWLFVILDTAQAVLAMVLVSWLLSKRSANAPATQKRDVR